MEKSNNTINYILVLEYAEFLDEDKLDMILLDKDSGESMKRIADNETCRSTFFCSVLLDNEKGEEISLEEGDPSRKKIITKTNTIEYEGQGKSEEYLKYNID